MGYAPTLGRSWCLLGFTILCNNVDFWLFRSAYMFFFYYIHFGVTFKPKWAGYYIVNIFLLSLDLFVHVTIIKIYNTILDLQVSKYSLLAALWHEETGRQLKSSKCLVYQGANIAF